MTATAAAVHSRSAAPPAGTRSAPVAAAGARSGR